MTQQRKRALLAVGAVATILATILLANHLTTDPQNYTLIEPGLYLGGRTPFPPPGTRAVLNLCQIPDLFSVEVSRFQPIPDGPPAPSLEFLQSQVDFIAAQRSAGRTLFVHCNAGASRGPTVLAAYLMQRDHLTRDQALARLHALRPAVHPHHLFMDLLSQWQELHPGPQQRAPTPSAH